jgi:hypothetical protein
LRFELFEIVGLEAGGHDGQEFADPAGVVVKAIKDGQDRILDIIRDPWAVAGKDLVDVKGVAAGDSIDVFAAVAAGFGEVFDGASRERGELDAGKRMWRQLSEQLFQGMSGVDLFVAPGEDEEAAEAGYAAGQEFDEVDRGFVGPVDIFEYEEGRTGQLVESLEEIGE